MVDALSQIDKDLKNNNVSDALQQLKEVKEKLINEDEFCSSVPINLGLESRVHLDKVGYKNTEFNEQRGQMHMKCETFSKIWNSDETANVSQNKFSNREQRKIKKISQALQDNLFKPVTVDGVEYKANAQALLYRYFTTMKSSTVTITSENVKESIELLKLSCELGGFPILKVKTEVEDLGEDKNTLIQLSRLQRVLVKENTHYYRKSILHLLAEGQSLD